MRHLLLADGLVGDPIEGKVLYGFLRYAPGEAVAIVDRRAGMPELEGVPVVESIEAGLALRPERVLLASTPIDGRLTAVERGDVSACLRAGLGVDAGLHELLGDDAELSALAREHGARIRDLRRAPTPRTVSGENLEHGALVVHTVGSDGGIGKMTACLELHAEALRRGCASVFVPTGQTGMMISGWGVAVDAVVSDYLAGAAELVVVEGAARGDLLWVEGQGSIVHPRYSGVTLGLYHGAAPHLLILCHLAGRTHVEDDPRWPIPPLSELVALYESIALPARPARVVGVVLNTSRLDEAAAHAALAAAEEETGLPAADPRRFEAGALVDAVLAHDPRQGPA